MWALHHRQHPDHHRTFSALATNYRQPSLSLRRGPQAPGWPQRKGRAGWVVEVEAWSSRPPSPQDKPSRPDPRGTRSFFRWELHLAPLGSGPLPDGWDEGERDDQAGATLRERAPRRTLWRMCRYSGTRYKTHYVCLPCRASFKVDFDPERERPCLHCRLPMIDAGRDFAVPQRTDRDAWRALAVVFNAGLDFHSCGCGGMGFRPRTPAQVRGPYAASGQQSAATGPGPRLRRKPSRRSARNRWLSATRLLAE
jgi:hypothetical protein